MKNKVIAGIAALLLVGGGVATPAHASHQIDITPDRWVCKWFPVFC